VEILGKTSFDFIGKRYIAYAVSTVLVLLGIVGLIQISRGAANMGIDFAGGTSTQVKFERPVDLGAVREALSKNEIKDSEPQQFADGRSIMVRPSANCCGSLSLISFLLNASHTAPRSTGRSNFTWVEEQPAKSIPMLAAPREIWIRPTIPRRTRTVETA